MAGDAWSVHRFANVTGAELPLALAELHRDLAVGAAVDLRFPPGVPGPGTACGQDDDLLTLLLTGAGFEVVAVQDDAAGRRVRGVRLRTLADFVRPGMRLLLVGLNPSCFAADASIPYARPGNRLWPAALAAGIVGRDRDPRDALVGHGVGMTDMVKRSTASASEIRPAEYRTGLARIDRLARWSRPGLVCFVGLAGWRAAVDRDARPGRQAAMLGGAPCYLMPSTSGANAHASLGMLAAHLRDAAALADRPWGPVG